jgi:hypothetical protein
MHWTDDKESAEEIFEKTGVAYDDFVTQQQSCEPGKQWGGGSGAHIYEARERRPLEG